jgi:3-(3-hydroxy-phenyl)propionate hydroxylase
MSAGGPPRGAVPPGGSAAAAPQAWGDHASGVDYRNVVFDYARSPDQAALAPVHHPVIVVGAGPVGLATAIDLARQRVPTLLLDDDDTLSTGSRAICFSKRTLEILDRLGCGERVVQKGVSWNVGKVYFQDELVYTFNLLPEPGHRRPAFINLQQYYLEGFLCERAAELDALEVRWKNKVVALEPHADRVVVGVETPEGRYTLSCAYLVACDGVRSPVRGMLGLHSTGHAFRDRFLITDVRMKADFPAERWFWFDPPFHRGQSALLHMQPDGVWRIDFQLGFDADPVAERAPERVTPRVQAMLGAGTEFELEWVSVYTFSCLRMERFRHGRVIFAGDAAHVVSPFGARGANSGVQDAENLAWKLRLVVAGRAPERLLDTYDDERVCAADENILSSTRATDFITPKSAVSRTFRDAVLKLAKDHPFARRLVNSGRLSVPATLTGSTLNTPDRDLFAGGMVPGAPCTDAPIRVQGTPGWFLSHIGDEFCGVYFCADAACPADVGAALERLARAPIPVKPLVASPSGTQPAVPPGLPLIEDAAGLLAQRFDALPGTYYLFRPDQHVCARWRRFDPQSVEAAVARATCNA